MYLLVFVTLVVSLIGIYAEALSLQTARMAQNQTAVIQEMLRWHSTAISQTRYAQITIPAVGGCDLTQYAAIPPLTGALCQNSGSPPGPGGNVIVSTAIPASWAALTLACSGKPTPPCWTPLPPDYKTTPYTFYSIYYRPGGGQNYVITFVPPPASLSPGFLMLPGGPGTNRIGITMSDLAQQIRLDGLAFVSYGMITNVNGACGAYCLVTPSISNGVSSSSLQFPLPTVLNAAAYNGSIAIISSP